MGKTKKPFIDKKKASTYHVLYRSQRDVADADVEGGGEGGIVLWPSPNNNKETDRKVLLAMSAKDEVKVSDSGETELKDGTLTSWKDQLAEVGLVDDFDYEKHTKPIKGDGQFFSNTTMNTNKKELDAMVNARAMDVKDEIVQEVDRQLDSIALTSDCMDDEIAQMLFGDFEEGEFEELNDEFVLDAAEEPETTEDGEAAFDYATHIQGLIAKAKMQSDGLGPLATIHEAGRKDQDFFANAKRVDKGYNDSDDESGYFDENDFEIEGTPGVVPKLSGAEEQALCDKFNEALAEYDSDDMGGGYSDDDVLGDLPLEGNAQIEAALDDFLTEKKDEIFMKGHRHYMEGNNNGGSGFSALVGTKMVPVKDIVEPSEASRGIKPITEVLGEADDTLRNPHEAPPAEEIFIDGKSYFSERMKNPWDCESILSTYSNLDNNPMTIGGGGRRRRRKPKKGRGGSNDIESSNPTEYQTIQLSEKTGLPLGVLPSGRGGDYDEDESYFDGADTYMSVNKGEKRTKDETKEEKKLRKLTVKKERQLARMQKKIMKEAFTEEFAKRQQEVMNDDVGGKTVFRF
mmetsp:Transcript_1875/g.4130  ORF Transcript_1875/g.4130 Transcript_1875/m.4130 type:complete len:572 (-) Transcript_1875:242-1957(-)